MTAEPPPRERRAHARRRTLYRGTITHSDRAVSIDCVVRDVAPGGARIELTSELPVPELFELSVPQLEFAQRPVRLRWSRGKELGVVFVDTQHLAAAGGAAEPAGAAPGAAATLSERVAKLEHDVARLHRQLADLRNDIKRYRGEGD